MSKRPRTLEEVHAMKPKAMATFFRSATEKEILEFTDPCNGDAHSNPYIDYCGVCLGIRYGRMLKRLPVKEED